MNDETFYLQAWNKTSELEKIKKQITMELEV